MRFVATNIDGIIVNGLITSFDADVIYAGGLAGGGVGAGKARTRGGGGGGGG